MSDLIKRDDAIREVSEPFDEYMWDGVLHPIRYIVSALKAVPSVDAVSVVRCKECKYYAEHNELYINAPTNCVKHSTINHYVAVNADDFCSYGERSEE